MKYLLLLLEVVLFNSIQYFPVKAEPLDEDNAKLLFFLTNQDDTIHGEKRLEYSFVGSSKSSWEGYKYTFFTRKNKDEKLILPEKNSIVIVLYQTDVTFLNVLAKSFTSKLTGKIPEYKEKIGFISLELNEVEKLNSFLIKHLNDINAGNYPKAEKTTEFKFNTLKDLNFGIYFIYHSSYIKNQQVKSYISISDLYFFMDYDELVNIQKLIQNSIDELSVK